MMATELPLLLPALVLLCHHLGRIRLFAELEDVRAHRAYLAHRAHLDPHPAHYLQFHLHPVPVLDLYPAPDPDPVLDLDPNPVLNPDPNPVLNPDPDPVLDLQM